MKIHHQSVFDTWPFEDSSIQAIITSPPYWSLRKYDIPDVVIGGDDECEHGWGEDVIHSGNGDGQSFRRDRVAGIKRNVNSSAFCIHCNAWKGQYGLEPSFKEYIEHIRLWAREAWRVLRDDGVMFLNLGDSYSGMKVGNTQGCYGDGVVDKSKSYANRDDFVKQKQDIPSKCKLLIPHRVAIALIDDGWILRNDNIWFKPNSMPESCKDRFSKKFEYIFMFVKQPKYYFDLDGVRENLSEATIARINQPNVMNQTGGDKQNKLRGNPGKGNASRCNRMTQSIARDPKGKNPGDLWTFNAQPSSEKHYAMWPEKLVERMILCSTKPDDTVLDPFAGSGTTLLVADRLNRKAQGIDLGYKDIQERRLANIQKQLL